MVAGAQRPDLATLPPLGGSAHGRGICPLNPAALFNVFEVSRETVSAVNDIGRPTDQHLIQFWGIEEEVAFATQARWNIAPDLIEKPVLVAANVLLHQWGPERAHTAIDIEPHAGHAHDALFRIKRRHAAYRETVAGMDVGHRESRKLNAGQR